MTNYEKYKDEIEKVTLEGGVTALVDGYITNCNGINCNTCDFFSISYDCDESRKNWLNAEFQEPEIDWTKVPKGTHVWVRNSESDKWSPRLFMGLNDENFDISPYLVSSLDLWVSEHEMGIFWMGINCRYCKLDDSVDPTPYYKTTGD